LTSSPLPADYLLFFFTECLLLLLHPLLLLRIPTRNNTCFPNSACLPTQSSLDLDLATARSWKSEAKEGLVYREALRVGAIRCKSPVIVSEHHLMNERCGALNYWRHCSITAPKDKVGWHHRAVIVAWAYRGRWRLVAW
jgi:hypothetical protein